MEGKVHPYLVVPIPVSPGVKVPLLEFYALPEVPGTSDRPCGRISKIAAIPTTANCQANSRRFFKPLCYFQQVLPTDQG